MHSQLIEDIGIYPICCRFYGIFFMRLPCLEGVIAQLIEAVNCKVVYLPPYSPDLNRIEKCWAWLKSRIRKQLRESHILHEAIDAVLKQAAS